MTPSLVHGDLLRTEIRPAHALKPGMICVLSPEKGTPVVHRIAGIRNFRRFIIVRTMGDSSGMDDQRWLMENGCSVETVTGVLRAGKYRRVYDLSALSRTGIELLRKRLSAIVRFLWW